MAATEIVAQMTALDDAESRGFLVLWWRAGSIVDWLRARAKVEGKWIRGSNRLAALGLGALRNGEVSSEALRRNHVRDRYWGVSERSAWSGWQSGECEDIFWAIWRLAWGLWDFPRFYSLFEDFGKRSSREVSNPFASMVYSTDISREDFHEDMEGCVMTSLR